MPTVIDSADTRELRLGLVMTGGVSLAVWMGGVAGEIYRCTKDHGLYGDLAELTETKVIVDVMSGASAGGLNGAFLGTAIAYGLEVHEFDELRDLWLEVGSFSQLLRDPMKKDPPSLLQGDAFFTVKIQEIISKWLARKENKCVLPLGQQSLTVILTTSLLSAELQRFTDDFDTDILEPNHRALFTFQDEHFRDANTLAARLALAARTTASFPGAFEASYIPIGESKPGSNGAGSVRTQRPDMDGIASFPRSHWAVDGGVLVNKPVGPALAAILKRSSKSEVRRVVAYVNPDPGAPLQGTDVEAAVPTIGEVVLKSVVSLPRAESIANHLEELREINQRTSDKRDLRDSLLRGVRLGPVSKGDRRQIDVPDVAEQLYPYWIKQRSTQAVDIRLEAHFVKERIDQTQALSHDDDKAPVTFRELRLALEQARGDQNWLATQLPIAANPSAGDQDTDAPINLSREDATWCWGFQPLEYIADFALDLIHRTFSLLPLGKRAAPVRRALGDLRARVHTERAFLRTMRSIDEDYWEDSLATLAIQHPDIIDCAPKLAKLLYEGWPVPPVSVWKLDSGAGRTAGRLNTLTLADRTRLGLWRTFIELVVLGHDDVERKSAPEKEPQPPPLVDIVKPLGIWGDRSPANTKLADELRSRTRAAEMRIAFALSGIVLDLGDSMARAITINRDRMKPKGTDKEERDPCAVPVTDPAVALREIGVKLGILVDAHELRGVGTTDDRLLLAPLLRQLLSVYVVHSCTVANIKETPRLELIQMSAFCQNEVAPGRFLPEHKVAGLQVGHFGGFLKRSWRANDWMWGAMDGAARIVAMLIDPARLRQRFENADEAMEALQPILTGRGRLAAELNDREKEFLDDKWEAGKGELRAELALIFVPPGTPLPRRLEKLCAMATTVAQLVICKNQLPVVAQAVVTSAREGGAESVEAVEFVEALRAVLEPHPRESTADRPRRRLLINDVPALLDHCTIGMETASDELASDLGAATAARAAAVAATAVSGTQAGLGSLSVPAKSLRAAVLGVYFTTAAALRKTRIGVATTFLLLAIGAGAIGARLLGADVPSPVLVVALLLLAVWLLYTGASAKAWWTSIIGAVALAVIALSFIDPLAACTTFATEGCDSAQPGWKSNMPQIVAVVLGLAAISCLVTSIRYLFERSIQKNLELLGSPMLVTRPERIKSFLDSDERRTDLTVWLSNVVTAKAFKMLVAAVVLAMLAMLYPVWVHSALFEGSPNDNIKNGVLWIAVIVCSVLAIALLLRTFVGTYSAKRLSAPRAVALAALVILVIVLTVLRIDPDVTLQRGDIIRWVKTLSDNRPIAVLAGIPAVFIALEYGRTQYQMLHSRAAHNTALVRLRKRRAKAQG